MTSDIVTEIALTKIRRQQESILEQLDDLHDHIQEILDEIVEED